MLLVFLTLNNTFFVLSALFSMRHTYPFYLRYCARSNFPYWARLCDQFSSIVRSIFYSISQVLLQFELLGLINSSIGHVHERCIMLFIWGDFSFKSNIASNYPKNSAFTFGTFTFVTETVTNNPGTNSISKQSNFDNFIH